VPYFAFNKDAFSKCPKAMSRLGWISLSQQACRFAVECTGAISGFRSLRGLKQRSSFSLRARHDLPFWNLLLGGRLLRDFWLHPVIP
jgi:hypothetical protein